MKRFFSWTAADGRNQSLKESLVSATHADVLIQRPLPPNGQRIQIVFPGASATEEEQCVPIRAGAIEFPREPISKRNLQRGGLSLLACP